MAGFEALGQRLRDRREELGLSLHTVSEKTRIPLNVLAGIEAGDPTGLPAPVFIKGFLRSYSIEIGLSPEEIIQEYKFHNPDIEQGVAVPITARHDMERRSRLRIVALVSTILALGLVALAVFYYPTWKEWGLFGRAVSEVKEQIDPQPEPGPAPGEEPAPTPTTLEPEPVTPPEPEAEPAPAPDSAAAAGSSDTTEPRPAPAPPREGHELKMVFEKVAWVQVVIDRDKMEHGLYGPGTTKTWKAKKGFYLRIGNAGGVKLIFDGREIDKLGPENRAVNLVLPKDYKYRSPPSGDTGEGSASP